MQQNKPAKTQVCQVDLLLEEYRSLNSLLLFRLNALNRSLPVSSAFLSILVGSVLALPARVQVIVLLLLPISIVWMTRVAITHAQSKVDHLARIAEIEREINLIYAAQILVFQSQHPNNGITGGRSGHSIVVLAVLSALSMLMLCHFIFSSSQSGLGTAIYSVCVAATLCDIAAQYRRLCHYQYSRPTHN